MRKILKNELMGILENHKKWLEGDLRGVRAALSDANLSGADLRRADLSYADLRGANLSDTNLSDADLSGADLSYADLRGANLSDTNLSDADLSGADLRRADLSYADLRGANLSDTNLSDADLSGADLRRADLSYADLRGANLKEVKYDYTTRFFALQCPEEGTFIGFKKARKYIVKLEIPAEAKRSSATSRKCRVSKAKVLSITSIDGLEEIEVIRSNYDSNFIYKIGETIEVSNFDENRWKECSTGIHCFITRQEAVSYN